MEQKKTFLSEEEYLELERKADYKSEYYKGETFALAGGTFNHNLISGNIFSFLHLKLKDKNCFPFTNDMKLFVSSVNLFTYPDVMVLCDKPEFYDDKKDIISNPALIIEVLSKSTESYDRGKKFEFYRTLDSLKGYILISQSYPMVEVFTRKDNEWVLSTENNLDKAISIKSLQIDIPLNEIYAKVEFNEEDNKLR